MRVSDHVRASSAMALALYPIVGKAIGLTWVSSIFIDVDHYLWYAAKRRRSDPLAVVADFTSYTGCHRVLTERARPLHGILPFAVYGVLGWRFRAFRPVLAGLLFHRVLDLYADQRTQGRYAQVLARDGYACQVCEKSGVPLDMHSLSGRDGSVMNVSDAMAVCPACHERLHEMLEPDQRQTGLVQRLRNVLARL